MAMRFILFVDDEIAATDVFEDHTTDPEEWSLSQIAPKHIGKTLRLETSKLEKTIVCHNFLGGTVDES